MLSYMAPIKNAMNIIYKNKLRVAKNIKTIRCYLELSKTEFGDKTGIGKRAIEFENGRFLPSMDELKKIADLSEIPLSHIINNHLQTRIEIH